jgi:hypothetical protein
MDFSGVEGSEVHYKEISPEGPPLPRRRFSLSREGEFLALGVIVLGASFLYPLVEGLVGRVTPGCIFYRITGIPCLLCGMTRSMAATSQGHLVEAFRFHLLGPPLFLLIVVVTAALAAEFIISRPILPRPGKRTRRIMAWGTLGLLIVAWVVRLAVFGANI